MAEDFGFVPDSEEGSNDFGFVPQKGKVSKKEAKLISIQNQINKEAASPGFQQAQNLNELLRQKNIQSGLSAIPLYGSIDAAKAGYQTGQDVLGQNLAGKTLGTIFGGAEALGTIFNPVTKAASNIPLLTQAGAESLGGQPELSQASLTGERPVLPNLQPSAINVSSENIPGSQAFNTGANFLSELITQARKDPVNAGLLFAGATNPKAIETAKGIPGSLASDIKSLTSKAGEKVKGPTVERLVRSAIKPKNDQIGQAVENAAKSEIADIFNLDPNADQTSPIPFEGFVKNVSALKKQVEANLDQVRSSIGEEFTAGNDIATSLEKRADQLQRAGEPADSIQYLRDRANNLRNNLTSIGSLQDAVTLANQRNSPLFQRARAAQDPIRAGTESVANSIIAQEGGNAINSALESAGGPQAAGLRKKWANLTTIERNARETLNKIINKAPAELQPQLLNALSSAEGVFGVFTLLHGDIAGILPAATGALKSWASKAAKELKDPNSLIERTYNQLRKNQPVGSEPFSFTPPPPKPGQPGNPIRIDLNNVIGKSISKQSPSSIPLDFPLAADLLTSNGINTSNPVVNSFEVPSTAQLNQVIQRLIQEQQNNNAAAQAASNVGYF